MQLDTYDNPLGLIATGTCCNGQSVPSTICFAQCNTQVFLCLDSYRSNSSSSFCPYGSRLLSAINGQNSLVFTKPTFANNENPVLIPFSDNYQQNGYRLKITVTDQKTNHSQLIDFLVIDFKINVPYQLNSSDPVYLSFQSQGNRTVAPKTK